MPASIVIARPSADEYSAGVGGYLADVGGTDAWPVLVAQRAEVEQLFGALSEKRALHRYAPGKWSVKEVLGHLCDAERIYAYRALRFARNDPTTLPGFEENDYVPMGRFDVRPLRDLLDEWQAVRSATLALYRGLDGEALLRRGVANGNLISVRAMAWMAAGHTLHHLGVVRARYAISP